MAFEVGQPVLLPDGNGGTIRGVHPFGQTTLYLVESPGVKAELYSGNQLRSDEPAIVLQIEKTLGDLRRNLNLGHTTGAYEALNRCEKLVRGFYEKGHRG